jgi:NitT/TauT family transport system ATP-binding protein
VIRRDILIDLPDRRDQLHTRSSPRFAELRAQVYAQIHRPREEHLAGRPTP